MSTNYSPTIVTDGAVFVVDALMPSTATSATTLYDRAGSYDGTMYNGSCLDFDGTDDHVTVGSSGMNASTTAITTSMWISFDAMSDGWILANLSIADYTKGYLVRVDYPSYQVGFYVGTGSGSNSVWSTNTLSLSTWYHIVCTYKSGEQLIYVNGVVWASGTGTGSIDYTGITTGYIGVASDLSRDFNGQIANLMIYDTVLSASQVKEIYNDSKVIIPSNVSQTNLKCWLPMGEGAGEYVYDGSGNGSDGTIVNASTNKWLTGQTGAPQLVEGYNRPMLFGGSGSGDDVKVGDQDSSNMLPTAAVTVCAWAYSSTWSSMSNKRIYSNTEVGGMSLGPRVDGGVSYIFIVRTDLSGGSYSYGTGVDTQTLSNNTWHHLAATFDGRYIKQYLDGVLGGTVDLGATYTIQYPTTFSTFFGDECSATNPTGTHNFDGIINEVIVYSKALDAADLLKLAATDANGGPLPPDPYGVSYATSGVSSSNIGGYWRNDGNVTWTDRSGNGYTGTVQGSPDTLLFKQGYNGSKNVNTGRDGQGFPLKYKDVGAVGFNDTDGYIDAGTGFNHTAALTCEVWASMYTGSGVIFSQWVQDGNKRKWFIGTNTTNVLFYIDSAGSGTFTNVDGGAYPTDGKFHSYAFVYIPSVSFTAYIDGVVVGTDTSSVASSIYSSTDVNIYLGRSGAGEYWDGQIGNARIYTRALSYAEIQQNYNAQRSRFE